jgi:hypothetical protein
MDNICLNRLRNLLTIISEDEQKGISGICDPAADVVKQSIMHEPGFKELLMLYYYHLMQDTETEEEKTNVRNQYQILVKTLSNLLMFVDPGLKDSPEINSMVSRELSKRNEEADAETGNNNELSKLGLENLNANANATTQTQPPAVSSNNIANIRKNISNFKAAENEKLDDILTKIEGLNQIIANIQQKTEEQPAIPTTNETPTTTETEPAPMPEPPISSNTIPSNTVASSTAPATSTEGQELDDSDLDSILDSEDEDDDDDLLDELKESNSTAPSTSVSSTEAPSTETPSMAPSETSTTTPAETSTSESSLTGTNTSIAPRISNMPATNTATPTPIEPSAPTSNTPVSNVSANSSVATTPNTSTANASITAPVPSTTESTTASTAATSTSANTSTPSVSSTISSASTNNRSANNQTKEINDLLNEIDKAKNTNAAPQTGGADNATNTNANANANSNSSVSSSENANANENNNAALLNTNAINKTINTEELKTNNSLLDKFLEFVAFYDKVDKIDPKVIELVNTAFKTYDKFSNETKFEADLRLTEDEFDNFCINNINDNAQIAITLNDPRLAEYLKIYKDLKAVYLDNCEYLLTLLEKQILIKQNTGDANTATTPPRFTLRELSYSDLAALETDVRNRLVNMYAQCQQNYQAGIKALFVALKESTEA